MTNLYSSKCVYLMTYFYRYLIEPTKTAFWSIVYIFHPIYTPMILDDEEEYNNNSEDNEYEEEDNNNSEDNEYEEEDNNNSEDNEYEEEDNNNSEDKASREAIRAFTQMLSVDLIHDFEVCLSDAVSDRQTSKEFSSIVVAFTQKLTADQLAQFHVAFDAVAFEAYNNNNEEDKNNNEEEEEEEEDNNEEDKNNNEEDKNNNEEEEEKEDNNNEEKEDNNNEEEEEEEEEEDNNEEEPGSEPTERELLKEKVNQMTNNELLTRLYFLNNCTSIIYNPILQYEYDEIRRTYDRQRAFDVMSSITKK